MEATMNVRIYQLALRTFTPEGTLKSAEKMIPYIARMGFTHIQLTPHVLADDGEDRIYWSERQKASGTENPMNNYRLKDYFHTDPEYGTDADFSDFVRTAHQHHLGVIVDLVYFHCGPNAVFLKEHPDFVQRNADGSPYCGLWHFPVINYESRELREYLWSNMEYFIREYDVDGYRCDVGDKEPLDFWTEGIRRCRAIKPGIFMLNEGRELSWLNEFDCNYFSDVCFEAPKVVLGEMTARAYQDGWEAWRRSLPEGGRMLHFLDNHDVASDSFENRLEKVLGHDAMDVLHILDYTLDGIPFVFCGNELADDLKHCMFSNRFHGKDPTVQWENALCEVGQKRMELVKTLNAFRDRYNALNTTDLIWLEHDCPDAVLAYVRQGKEKEESILVVLNMRSTPLEVTLSDEKSALTKNTLCQTELTKVSDTCVMENAYKVSMPGFGYLVASFNG